MKLTIRAFCAAMLVALFVMPLPALAVTARELDAYMKPFVAAKHFSGVILVTEKGRVVYAKGFGLANAEHNVPNTLESRFCIASITKAMTRAILVNLLLEKKLALKDPLSKFIPDFPRGTEITVELLARHRSGLPHRVTTDAEESQPMTAADVAEKAKKAALLYEPGKDSRYSSAGYSVLARVLEIASGKSYAQLLQQYIFAPAAMKTAVEFDNSAVLPHRAAEYFLDRGGLVPAELKDYSFLVGAGSVMATAQDVLDFGNAALDGKFGESVKQSLTKDGVFSDNGSVNGARANFLIDRRKNYSYVVLANMESGATDMIIRDLPLMLDGKKVETPAIPKPAIVPPANDNLEELTGTYRSSFGEFTVSIKNGEVYAGRYHFLPLGKDHFYCFANYGDIVFNRDAAGKIEKIVWTIAVGPSEWVKQ